MSGIDESGTARRVRCPHCGTMVEYSTQNRWRPFCSERCRRHDLGAWAAEQFRVPAAPKAVDGEAPPGPDPRH